MSKIIETLRFSFAARLSTGLLMIVLHFLLIWKNNVNGLRKKNANKLFSDDR